MMSQQKRVLMFEDDFESMGALKEYTEEEFGWHVELSAEHSLLERLAHERYDLVMVDLMIHSTSFDANGNEVQNVHFEGINWRETGLEFLRRLRRGELCKEAGLGTQPDVPVVILSAIANETVEKEIDRDFCIQAYLEKPFRLEEIVNLMSQLLQE
jgi:CheY-like chemotaxis protein